MNASERRLRARAHLEEAERLNFEAHMKSIGCAHEIALLPQDAGHPLLYRTIATQVMWNGWLARARWASPQEGA